MPLDRIDISFGDDDAEAAESDVILRSEAPIEPGDPSPENVLFVLLGVAMALAVVGRLVLLYG